MKTKGCIYSLPLFLHTNPDSHNMILLNLGSQFFEIHLATWERGGPILDWQLKVTGVCTCACVEEMHFRHGLINCLIWLPAKDSDCPSWNVYSLPLDLLSPEYDKVGSVIRNRGWIGWRSTPTCLESLDILLDFWGCLLHNLALPILEFWHHERTMALGPRRRVYTKVREQLEVHSLAIYSTQQWLLRLAVFQSSSLGYDTDEKLNESGLIAGRVSKLGEVAYSDNTLETVGWEKGQDKWNLEDLR